jgi:hypothetical protein
MSMIDLAKRQLTKCAKCVGCERLQDDTFRGNDNCMTFKAAKPDLEVLRRTYNDNLKRMDKAMKYMDSDVSHEEKDKQLPRFKEVNTTLSGVIEDFKRAGQEMTETQIREGFKC